MKFDRLTQNDIPIIGANGNRNMAAICFAQPMIETSYQSLVGKRFRPSYISHAADDKRSRSKSEVEFQYGYYFYF